MLAIRIRFDTLKNGPRVLGLPFVEARPLVEQSPIDSVRGHRVELLRALLSLVQELQLSLRGPGRQIPLLPGLLND